MNDLLKTGESTHELAFFPPMKRSDLLTERSGLFPESGRGFLPFASPFSVFNSSSAN